LYGKEASATRVGKGLETPRKGGDFDVDHREPRCRPGSRDGQGGASRKKKEPSEFKIKKG